MTWRDQTEGAGPDAEGLTLPVLAMTEPHISVEMVVVQVRIYQPIYQPTPIIVSAPVQLIVQPIQAQTSFKLEAFLVATNPTSNQPTYYGAHLYARDLSTGRKLWLGQTQSVPAGGLYRFTLANIMLNPGTYHVQIFLTIRGAVGLGYLELPRLRVT